MTDVMWIAIDEAEGIRAANYKFPGGTSRCSIIRLSPSSFLVYSPGKGLAESALELLGTESEIMLLAPNAGHTLGLTEWNSVFPQSTVVASSDAIPQVRKRSSLASIREASTVEHFLPEHVSLHIVPACRWGEVWVEYQLEDKTVWIVCDAFINLSTLPDNRIVKTMMSLFRYGPGLEVSRPFRYAGIKDRKLYKRWVEQRFDTRKPAVLVPCHGNILGTAHAASLILKLMARRF